MNRPEHLYPKGTISQLLCFGDSNTWGFSPDKGQQLAAWPVLLQKALPGLKVKLDARPGRCTRFDKPDLGLSAASTAFAQYRSEHTLLLLMLGTNDLCIAFNQSPQQIADNLRHLIGNWPSKQLLIIAPPPLGKLSPQWQKYFAGQEAASHQLATCYQELAEQLHCGFFNAADYCASASDGVHLEQTGHQQLAKGLAEHLASLYGLVKS